MSQERPGGPASPPGGRATPEALVDAYLDEALEGDEERALEQWLALDERNLRALLRRASLHAALRDVLRPQPEAAPASGRAAPAIGQRGRMARRLAWLALGGAGLALAAAALVHRAGREARVADDVSSRASSDAPGTAPPRPPAGAGARPGRPATAVRATSPPARSPRRALLVVGDLNLGDGDAAMAERLQTLGFEVAVRAGSALASEDAHEADLVLVSATVSSRTMGGGLREAAVPLVTCEPWSLLDLGMTGWPRRGDGLTDTTEKRLVITGARHPLAADLQGSVEVTREPVRIAWGMPLPSATAIASVERAPSRIAIFAYERGSEMASLRAPARRVGFFLNDRTATVLTEAGWRLFDAAVRWATDPAVGATP